MGGHKFEVRGNSIARTNFERKRKGGKKKKISKRDTTICKGKGERGDTYIQNIEEKPGHSVGKGLRQSRQGKFKGEEGNSNLGEKNELNKAKDKKMFLTCVSKDGHEQCTKWREGHKGRLCGLEITSDGSKKDIEPCTKPTLQRTLREKATWVKKLRRKGEEGDNPTPAKLAPNPVEKEHKSKPIPQNTNKVQQKNNKKKGEEDNYRSKTKSKGFQRPKEGEVKGQ